MATNGLKDHFNNEINNYTRQPKREQDNLCPGKKFLKNVLNADPNGVTTNNQFYCYNKFEDQSVACHADSNRLSTYVNKDPKMKMVTDNYDECGYGNDKFKVYDNLDENFKMSDLIQDRIRLRSWVVGGALQENEINAGFVFGNKDVLDNLENNAPIANNTQSSVPVNVLALLHENFVEVAYVKTGNNGNRKLQVKFKCPPYFTKTQVGKVTQFWRDRMVEFPFPTNNAFTTRAASTLSDPEQAKTYTAGELLDDQFLIDYSKNGGNPRFMAYWDPYRRQNLLQQAVNFFLRRMLCQIQNDLNVSSPKPINQTMTACVGTGLFRLKFVFVIRMRQNNKLQYSDLTVKVQFETNPFPNLSDTDHVCVTGNGNVLYSSSKDNPNPKAHYCPMFKSSLDTVTQLKTESWDTLRLGVTNDLQYVPQIDDLGSVVPPDDKGNTLLDPSVMFTTITVSSADFEAYNHEFGMICMGSIISCSYKNPSYSICDENSPPLFLVQARLNALQANYDEDVKKGNIPAVNQLLTYQLGNNQIKTPVCFARNLKYMLFLNSNEWMLFHNGLHDGPIVSDGCFSNKLKDFHGQFLQQYCNQFVYDPNSETGDVAAPSFRQENNDESVFSLSGLYIDPICNYVHITKNGDSENASISRDKAPTNWTANPFQQAVLRSILNSDGFGSKKSSKHELLQSLGLSYSKIANANVNQESMCNTLLPMNGMPGLFAEINCTKGKQACDIQEDTKKISKDGSTTQTNMNVTSAFPRMKTLTEMLMFGIKPERFNTADFKLCMNEVVIEQLKINGNNNKLDPSQSCPDGGDGGTAPGKDEGSLMGSSKLFTPTNIAIFVTIGVVLLVALLIGGNFLYKHLHNK